MGFVYVLTNAAMPGLVKIGMTEGEDDAKTRIGQLYTTGVPLPFEIQYACRVDNPREVEQALHTAFGPNRINPKREFFRIDSEQAVVLLRLMHKPDATGELQGPVPNVDEASLTAAKQESARRPNLNFGEMGIPVGAILTLDSDPNVTAEVAGQRKVKWGEQETSLSMATQRALCIEYAVRPAPHWRFNGKLLSEIYEETYSEGE